MFAYHASVARCDGLSQDLEPAFVAHYQVHRERFDWPQDAHWNPLGHEMCFDAVAESTLLSAGFPEAMVG